jgi:hypothetical protein
MSARGLAELIQNYLEADDDGNAGSNGSSPSAGGLDSLTRQQLQQLSQKTDKLQADNDALKHELASIKNNLQMSAILPLMLNQSLSVVSDTRPNNIPGPLHKDEVLELKQADPLSALLPLLLMGGVGDSGGGSGDNPMNMVLLALALSGGL